MKKAIKRIIRYILPEYVRLFIWSLKPNIFKLNTLVLDDIKKIENLTPIPPKYYLHEVSWDDKSKLKKFYDFGGPSSFNKIVPKRLNSPICKGFAFIDSTTGDIGYMNWIHFQYLDYLKEFKIQPNCSFFFWDLGVCLPEHRHQGLHERMEQEIINYSVDKGAKLFYMQIHVSNVKGNKYAISKGYRIVKESITIYWPVFNVYRNLAAFLKNPFKG